jgi:predicted alpha/beta superfamily hydrolase
MSRIIPLLVLTAALASAIATDASAQSRQNVLFEINHTPAPGKAVYVLGDLPELGGNDLGRSVKLVSGDGSTWRVTVSLPVNRTYTYRFYERPWWAPDPTGVEPIGNPVTAQTNTVPLRPAAKVLYAHSSLDQPVLYWRQDDGFFEELAMEDFGPGRVAGERRWVAGPFGESRKVVEFFLTSEDGSQRDPAGTDTYATPLDAMLLQDGHLFTYVPAASVSPPRRDYEVLLSGLSSVTIPSSILGADYDVRVMLPRGYDEHVSRRYPVIYHADGHFLWEDPFLADPYDEDGAQSAELIRLGLMGEAIQVGVDNTTFGGDPCNWLQPRARDHSPPGDTAPLPMGCSPVVGEADRYAEFLRNELKPWIDASYRTRPSAEDTTVAGFSDAALGAFYLGWEFSETFGRVGSQSISADGGTNFLARVRGEPQPPIRVYLDSGGLGEFIVYQWALDLRDDLLAKTPPFVVEGDLRYFVTPGHAHSRGAAGSRSPEMLPFLRPATEEMPECYDGIDNDQDGLVDHVPGAADNDPDCESALDPSESAVPVQIDIKPWSDPNAIDPFSRGAVPVALLGSEAFDVSDVDVTTLAFGPEGAAPAFDLTNPLVYWLSHWDVNGDGTDDLLSYYHAAETGIAMGDSEACLTGETFDGVSFEGCDAVATMMAPWSCGLGAELALLLPLLICLRGRRQVGAR